ncbi:MAG TPA: PLP-dependent aminotransferase family protein [Roseiarcus sp.]|nr:PLP-dependent aminotransferase family protein [Roseiarcus sp.]
MQPINLNDVILLDRDRRLTLVGQLHGRLREMILNRTLKPGTEMPSTRSLAADLSIGRNTVIAAYDQLVAEGCLFSRPNATPVVVDLPAGPTARQSSEPAAILSKLSARGLEMLEQPFFIGQAGRTAFHPGMPDAEEFPFVQWSRLLAHRAAGGRESLFGTYDVLGYPRLRDEIASYLNAARGMRCSAEQVVVTTGAQGAFDLLARLLIDPGDAVWMEEPGYFGAQAAFALAGAKLIPLHVSLEGWRIETGPKPAPRVIYVTPSCHHPLGVTMQIEQRLRLLDSAERMNAWIVEDDYDSEFRFQGQSVPAMHGADNSKRVIYVGTFAKMLFPALRLAFMVLPPALAERVSHALSVSGHVAPLVLQAALADFISDGHLTRHLRRMRRLYSARREAFSEACNAELADRIELGIGSGIQAIGYLLRELDDTETAAAARRRGIIVSPLSMQYRHGHARQGLVLKFASTPAERMLVGVKKLKDAFLEVEAAHGARKARSRGRATAAVRPAKTA